MKSVATWEVFFHDEFELEFSAFSAEVQDELLASALAIKRLGPEADRPHVGTLNNPQHANMKELRFKANNGNEIWRAAFAFDPLRRAIILVAADKQGRDEKLFYKNLIKKANLRFDQHLKSILEEVAMSKSRKDK